MDDMRLRDGGYRFFAGSDPVWQAENIKCANEAKCCASSLERLLLLFHFFHPRPLPPREPINF